MSTISSGNHHLVSSNKHLAITSNSRVPLQEQDSNISKDHQTSKKMSITDTPITYKSNSKINTTPESIYVSKKKRLTVETPTSKHYDYHQSNSNMNSKSNNPNSTKPEFQLDSFNNANSNIKETALLSPAFSSPQQQHYFYNHDDHFSIPPPKPTFVSETDSIQLSSVADDDEIESTNKGVKKKSKKQKKELKETGFDIQSDGKPPYSYATLIGMSILTRPDKRLTLSLIYQWISDTFKYYKREEVGWQNSIRHNLSLNKAFIKGDKSKDGKGHFWCIKADCEDQFLKARNNKKSGYHEVMDQLKKLDQLSENSTRSINSIPSSPNFSNDQDDHVSKKRRFSNGIDELDSLNEIDNKLSDKSNRNDIYDETNNEVADDDDNDEDDEDDDDDTRYSSKTQHDDDDNDDLDENERNYRYSRSILDHPMKKQKISNSNLDEPFISKNIMSTPDINNNNPHFIVSESPNKPSLAGKNLTYTSSFSCSSNLELSPVRQNETGPLLEPLTPANNNYIKNSNSNLIQTINHHNLHNGLSSSSTNTHNSNHNQLSFNQPYLQPPIHHTQSNPHSLSQYQVFNTFSTTTTNNLNSNSVLNSNPITNNHTRTPKSNLKTPIRILKTPQTSSIMKKLWNSPSYLDDFYYSPLISSANAGTLNSYDDDDMIMRAFESPANQSSKRDLISRKSLLSSIDSSRNLFNDLKKIDSTSTLSSIKSEPVNNKKDIIDTSNDNNNSHYNHGKQHHRKNSSSSTEPDVN